MPSLVLSTQKDQNSLIRRSANGSLRKGERVPNSKVVKLGRRCLFILRLENLRFDVLCESGFHCQECR